MRAAWEAKAMREIRLKRSVDQQMKRREAERKIKKSVLALLRSGMRNGLGTAEVARQIGIVAGTLSSWARGWTENRLAIEARGRPLVGMNQTVRELVLSIFRLMGPWVGLPTLQAMFPWTPRAQLEDLSRRYRYAYRRRSSMLAHVLKWLAPGSVWAMDFKKAPLPVDGVYPWILVLRDLASGNLLLSIPVTEETARVVCHALTMLFKQCGKPLVIKSDNGSAFIAQETRAMLKAEGIWLLLSPPGTPEYNGACEAGIGSLTTRANQESFRNDRPGEWTCDDIEGARLMANQTARPQGYVGPTPDEAWSLRLVVSPEARQAFSETVIKCQAQARAEHGYLPDIELSRDDQDAIDRIAISRALVAHDYLTFRRRRISLPIKLVLRKKIS
jgi:transposase InsO family protein